MCDHDGKKVCGHCEHERLMLEEQVEGCQVVIKEGKPDHPVTAAATRILAKAGVK